MRYASAAGLLPASLGSLALLGPANCSQVRFWPALPAPHRAKLLVDVDGSRAFALPLEDRVQILGSHVLAHAVWARQRTRAQLRTSAGRALSQTSNGVTLFRCEINKRPSWSRQPGFSHPPAPQHQCCQCAARRLLNIYGRFFISRVLHSRAHSSNIERRGVGGEHRTSGQPVGVYLSHTGTTIRCSKSCLWHTI